MLAISQILMAENLSVVKDMAKFLVDNGLKRITFVAHDKINDGFLQNLIGILSKSGKFYMRIVPMAGDQVSHEDFYIFTPNSVRGNLSGVLDMVSKTKVIVAKRSRYPSQQQ